MIYLDTHVLVWLITKKLDLIPNRTRELIESEDLYMSPIVQLELQYLYEIKRISENAETIVDRLQRDIDLRICPLSFNEVVKQSLKETWTRDPFDRIICAQAKVKRAFLITKDEAMHRNCPYVVWD